MKVWTLQSAEVWKQLNEKGTLISSPALSSTSHDFPVAVEWLTSVLKSKIEGPDHAVPWWAWVTPTIRARAFRNRLMSADAGNSVCIELSVDNDRLILSSVSAWEAVLNQGYINLTSEEAIKLNGIDEIQNTKPGSQMQRQTKIIRSSWTRMFDIAGLEESGLWSMDRIQANFWELRLQDVIRLCSPDI